MVFIPQPAIINDIHNSITAHNFFIVSDAIKGAAPPAFNRTLERVALKQASNRNPPLQATFKQATPTLN